jgi:Rho termination factor, N-terminal domain
MGTRMTIDQLEKMKTHELADMLANIVLVLRRLPDVECKQLVQQVPTSQDREPHPEEHVAQSTASLTREELAKKKLADLKVLAKDLHVLFPNAIKKDDLINKILARSADGRSEQRMLQDL